MLVRVIGRLQAILVFLVLITLGGCSPTPGPSQTPDPANSSPIVRTTSPAETMTPSATSSPQITASASPSAVPATTSSPTAQSDTEEVDVLIVGAGLSGLSTAYNLKKAGISFRLLESTPRVGGRVRTGTYPNNTSAEVGLAEFWTGNPAIDVAKELGVELELVEPGLSTFIVDGKLYPFTTYNSNQEFIKASLGPDYSAYETWDKEMQGLVHKVESGSIPPEMMKLKEVSFESWLEKAKISPLAKKMVKAVLEPEIGTGIDKIGALDGISEWHLFVGKGATPNHAVGGNQKLTEAIANHLGRENISLDTQVTNVIDGPDGVEVRAMDTENFSNKTFRAKYVVLTVPLYRLFEIQFVPRLDDSIYKAIHSQGWGAYFTAHCLLDKEAEKFWTVDGVSVLPILSGGRLGVIYPGHDGGPKDEVMINLLVTGNPAEMYNARTMSLDDVQKSLEDGMEKTFPGSKKMIKSWTFYRYHPRAIASWPVGRSRFDELSNGLRKPHGHLYFAGDFTESSHSDGAMKSALRVSGQIQTTMNKK